MSPILNFSRVLIGLFILLCNTSVISSALGHRRLDSVSDIIGESYDKVHELIVLDQIESYKRPIDSLETRDHKSLNGLWDFCFDPADEGHRSKWFDGSLVEACAGSGNLYRMPVPSAFNEILTNKTAKNYMGWMWYQSSFRWPLFLTPGASMPAINQTWILQLESINYLSVIWLQIIYANKTTTEARLIGSHAGGHLPITIDLSLILGSFQKDERVSSVRLTIAVSNMLTSDTIPSGKMLNETDAVGSPRFKFQPDFDFFHFAGIMGDVNLFRLSKSYIEDAKLLTENENPSLILTLSRPLAEPHVACVETLNPIAGTVNEVGCTQVPVGCSLCTLQIEQNNHILADSSAVGLVRIILSREQNDEIVDIVEYKQMLTLEERNRRFPIDSQNTTIGPQLQGFGMHHEQLFSGRTMSLPAIMKDLYLLKQIGANVLRTSHYPYSRAYLDACDELGLMVIAECPAVGLNSFSQIKLTLHKQILKEMMQRDHGHTSIIMWSLANEPESQHPEARKYFSELTRYARQELRSFTVDAGIPLTAAIAQSHEDDKIGDLFDVIMVNRYYGWYDCTALIECVRHSLLTSLEGWAAKYPGKPLILSEFGADAIASLHSSTSELFSEEYQRDLLVEYEKVFDEISQGEQKGKINFLGAMIWNFADFSTHESLLRVGGNKKGIFSRWREPKLAVEAIRKIYTSRSSLVSNNNTS